MLSRRSALLRPAPTAARPPTPLPGFAGYRRGIASRHPAGDGAKTALPSSQDDHPRVQRPIRRRVPQRPLLEQEHLPWPSPFLHRLGTLSTRPKTDVRDDACSGFTRVADRTVDPAPLRTRPLDHARGHHYQGPRRLPGPDSHRQAALNLSLLYVMSTILSSWRRSSLGARRNRTKSAVGQHQRPAMPSTTSASGRRRSSRSVTPELRVSSSPTLTSRLRRASATPARPALSAPPPMTLPRLLKQERRPLLAVACACTPLAGCRLPGSPGSGLAQLQQEQRGAASAPLLDERPRSYTRQGRQRVRT
jgi:hypothetical protein